MPRAAPPPPETPAASQSGELEAIFPEISGLAGVRGQPQVTTALTAALRRGRPHHAYLFDGPEGVGKATCARALFAALNCLASPEPGAACGVCESCRKVAARTHPDLIHFDMTLSGLADEAEKLVRRLQFAPFEGRAQVVIFDPADQFTMPTAVTAANRLLKTLEEPRPDTHFVLITTAASSLLSTLRSRCQRLRFVPLSDAALAATLAEQGIGGDEAELQALIKLSQGSLGRARRYLQDREALKRASQAAAELYAAAQEGRATRLVEAAAEVGANREEAIEVLDLLWLRLHDELFTEVQASTRSSGPPGDKLTDHRRREQILMGLRAVRSAQQAVRGYTGAPLALERMLRHLSTALSSRPASSVRPSPASTL